jgi:hypothetical protein
MVELVRHRQTKGAGTDMSDLQPPRHISTLHKIQDEWNNRETGSEHNQKTFGE